MNLKDILIPSQPGILSSLGGDMETFKLKANALIEELEPVAIAHIESLNLVDAVHKIETMEELTAYEAPIAPNFFLPELAEKIDAKFPEESIQVRILLYIEVGKQILIGSGAYVRQILQQRAEAIMNSQIIKPKKNKIIMP